MVSQERKYRVSVGAVAVELTADKIEEYLRSLGNTGQRAGVVLGQVVNTLKEVGKSTPLDNFFGRLSAPQVTFLPQGLRVEFDLEDSLQIYVTRPNDVPIYVTRPNDPRTKEEDRSREKLNVERNGICYSLPSRGTGYGSSAHFNWGKYSAAQLVIRVVPETVSSDELLFAGSCIVHSGSPAKVSFPLINIHKHLASGEIATLIEKVPQRVEEELKYIYAHSRKRRAQGK